MEDVNVVNVRNVRIINQILRKKMEYLIQIAEERYHKHGKELSKAEKDRSIILFLVYIGTKIMRKHILMF